MHLRVIHPVEDTPRGLPIKRSMSAHAYLSLRATEIAESAEWDGERMVFIV